MLEARAAACKREWIAPQVRVQKYMIFGIAADWATPDQRRQHGHEVKGVGSIAA